MVPEFADKVPARAEALKDGGELILCLCTVTVASGDIGTNGGGCGTGARGHVAWIGSLPVRGDVDATDGVHDAGNAAGEGVLNGNEGEETLAEVEELIAGNSSCGIDGAVGGEWRIGMVVGAGAGGGGMGYVGVGVARL